MSLMKAKNKVRRARVMLLGISNSGIYDSCPAHFMPIGSFTVLGLSEKTIGLHHDGVEYAL